MYCAIGPRFFRSSDKLLSHLTQKPGGVPLACCGRAGLATLAYDSASLWIELLPRERLHTTSLGLRRFATLPVVTGRSNPSTPEGLQNMFGGGWFISLLVQPLTGLRCYWDLIHG